MVTRRISALAPTRIDLAGGTVDIWPLYLFLNQAVTINLGINLFAEAVLETSPAKDGKGKITLVSGDQNASKVLSWSELQQAQADPATILHLKLLQYFAQKNDSLDPTQDIKIQTRAKSPAGAGLGGSSTLSIALIGALATWAKGSVVDPVREGEKYIEIVRDVESTVIQVPAGLQDYYGAMFGGLQSIRWAPGTHHRAWLNEALIAELEKRTLLFYSGQSRNSGINNWALFKAFIDKDMSVRGKFQKIVDATLDLERALVARDWRGAGEAIASEWEIRRTLASGISTPEMDAAFAEARKIAPASGKVCGAGGGGCFFVYLPTEDAGERDSQRKRIVEAFEKQGIRPLPFKAVSHGLEVQVGNA